MSGPSLADLLASAPAIKAVIDKVFAAIEAASPQFATADEAAIREAINTALGGLDIASLDSSIAQLLAALKSGKSIQGGGADATLA